MTARLLKKEFRLCLHPTVFLMMALAALTLVPNYPYGVMYFYLTLGFFFVCMGGRENHDITFSMTLPVKRSDIVRSRALLFVVFELIHLLLAGGFAVLRQSLFHGAPNAAGMDANLSLIAEGFVYYGMFHLVFLPAYYKDTNKVGSAFVRSSAALFVLVIAEIAATYALPLFRDVLDTPDPEHLGVKLSFLAVCVILYVLMTVLAVRLAAARFQKLDIR